MRADEFSLSSAKRGTSEHLTEPLLRYLKVFWSAFCDTCNTLIIGGLTNQLYYVALREHVPLVADEPREVTIKFYQKKHMPQEEPGNERLSDMVIVMLASHLGIGPRVYGLFDEGMIQSYYQVWHLFLQYL